jgi:acyl carrier protein
MSGQEALRGPSRSEVDAEIAQLMSEIGRIPVARIHSRATIEDELQMPSVAFVELQVALEDRYDIELDPVRIVELSRFDAISEYIYETVLSGLG